MELHWGTHGQNEEAYNPQKRLISFENVLTNEEQKMFLNSFFHPDPSHWEKSYKRYI
jgi:hypothetical protein